MRPRLSERVRPKQTLNLVRAGSFDSHARNWSGDRCLSKSSCSERARNASDRQSRLSRRHHERIGLFGGRQWLTLADLGWSLLGGGAKGPTVGAALPLAGRRRSKRGVVGWLPGGLSSSASGGDRPSPEILDLFAQLQPTQHIGESVAHRPGAGAHAQHSLGISLPGSF